MNNKPENPLAFPSTDCTQNSETGEKIHYQSFEGMTLRDYFAAKAMQAIVTSISEIRILSQAQCPDEKDISEWAYLQADAMLAARLKK